MMIEARILTPAEWGLVEPVMAEFGNALPVTPAQGTFIGAFDEDGRLAGSVFVEHLLHAHCLWVAPNYRGTGRVAQVLVREVNARVPTGFSAIVLSDAPKVSRLLGHFGMRDLGHWQLLRKDF